VAPLVTIAVTRGRKTPEIAFENCLKYSENCMATANTATGAVPRIAPSTRWPTRQNTWSPRRPRNTKAE
jgi:hypothetical protein